MAFAFFSKTAENENLRYLILLQNCGKCKFSFFVVTCKVNLIPFRALLHVKFSLHIFFVYISIQNVLAHVTLTVLLLFFGSFWRDRAKKTNKLSSHYVKNKAQNRYYLSMLYIFSRSECYDIRHT